MSVRCNTTMLFLLGNRFGGDATLSRERIEYSGKAEEEETRQQRGASTIQVARSGEQHRPCHSCSSCIKGPSV